MEETIHEEQSGKEEGQAEEQTNDQGSFESKSDIRETPARSRPTKTLPTPRIAFEKQLDILRAYPALSGTDRKPVTNKDVAELVRMAEGTVSLANGFFVELNLLTRQDSALVPSEEAFQFLKAYKWEKETAARKLAPCLLSSWFAEVLLPQLSFGPMKEKRVLSVLGEAATAGPEYTNQLLILIRYLEEAGIVERENGLIKEAINDQAPSAMPARLDTAQREKNKENVDQQEQRESRSVQPVIIQGAENLIQFQIAISVDMKEISQWSADRIGAFFHGIAEVMTAKGNMEKNRSQE